MPNPDSQCPYCKHDFGKPVKGKRVCPACKNTIVIRAGHPVTETKAKAIDDKREAAREAAYMREVSKIRRETIAHTQKTLNGYAREGVRSVVVRTCYDACPACRSMEGKIYLLADAVRQLPIPITGCENDWCRCSIEIQEYGSPMKEAFRRDLEGNSAGRPRATKRKPAGCLVFLLTGIALAALALCTLLHW